MLRPTAPPNFEHKSHRTHHYSIKESRKCLNLITIRTFGDGIGMREDDVNDKVDANVAFVGRRRQSKAAFNKCRANVRRIISYVSR